MAARYLSHAEIEAMIGDNDKVDDDKDPDFRPNESEDGKFFFTFNDYFLRNSG